MGPILLFSHNQFGRSQLFQNQSNAWPSRSMRTLPPASFIFSTSHCKLNVFMNSRCVKRFFKTLIGHLPLPLPWFLGKLSPTSSPKICPVSTSSIPSFPNPSLAAWKCSWSSEAVPFPIGPHPNFAARKPFEELLCIVPMLFLVRLQIAPKNRSFRAWICKVQGVSRSWFIQKLTRRFQRAISIRVSMAAWSKPYFDSNDLTYSLNIFRGV